jgi:hypothetical protein
VPLMLEIIYLVCRSKFDLNQERDRHWDKLCLLPNVLSGPIYDTLAARARSGSVPFFSGPIGHSQFCNESF